MQTLSKYNYDKIIIHLQLSYSFYLKRIKNLNLKKLTIFYIAVSYTIQFNSIWYFDGTNTRP